MTGTVAWPGHYGTGVPRRCHDQAQQMTLPNHAGQVDEVWSCPVGLLDAICGLCSPWPLWPAGSPSEGDETHRIPASAHTQFFTPGPLMPTQPHWGDWWCPHPSPPLENTTPPDKGWQHLAAIRRERDTSESSPDDLSHPPGLHQNSLGSLH